MRGFSLIEAMVVVAIAGIVCALAVPSISDGVRKERARSEALKAADAIERGRQRARIQVCTVLLTVNTSSVVLAPDPAESTVACRTLPSETIQLDSKLVTLTPFKIGATTTNPLVLNNEGGFSGTTRARMTVTMAGGGARTVEVWPAIGTVRLLP